MFRYCVLVTLLTSFEINASTLLPQGKSVVLGKFLSQTVEPESSGRGFGKNVFNVKEQVDHSNWPLGIVPYYFDTSSYDFIVGRRLRVAMNTLESISCIKFKPLILKPTDNSSWIHFTNPSQLRECTHGPSVTDGEKVMVLGLDCLSSTDIIKNLLHSIGFRDEVTHPQRDQFVRILWENIQPKYRYLFRMWSDENPNKNFVEYDPLSVMHFHDRAFSRNGHATIVPLVPGLIIKPSNDLSQLDRMKLQLLFGHECNKRKVGDLLDTCKIAFHDNVKGDSGKKNGETEKKSEKINEDISKNEKSDSENQRNLSESDDTKKRESEGENNKDNRAVETEDENVDISGNGKKQNKNNITDKKEKNVQVVSGSNDNVNDINNAER